MDIFAIAIISTIAGIILLIWAHAAQKQRIYSLIGVGVILFGITVIVLQILAPNYTLNFIAFTVGAIFCIASVHIVAKTYSCKEKVSAVLEDYGFERYKAHVTAAPIFLYRYAGKSYKNKVAESYSRRHALKRYKIGETYPIFLSKKDPNFFKLKRRVHIFELLLFIIGLMFMIPSVIVWLL